ncbi:MAG: hypothetical protein IAF94_22220 [Pirellulaceae bacterium]|nr:hypothetical protein [Pirellulaceae bacterium]
MTTTAAGNPEFPLLARPKISSGRLVLGCLGMALLTVVAAVAIPWMISNRQAAARLSAAVQRVKARGEPLTSAELNEFYQPAKGRPDMTKELMAALKICEAAGKLPIAPSLPIVGQGAEPPPRGQEWTQLAELEKYLAGQQQALDTFHEFAHRNGTARFPVDFTPGVATLLPETQRTREGSRALSLQFHVHRHKGELAEAVNCIISKIALADALEQEPLLISQLVRIAILNVSIAEVQQLLREAQVPDADLRRLQAQLRKIDSKVGLKNALVGERAIAYTTCLDPEQMAQLHGPNQGLADELAKRQPKRILDAAKMLELNLQIAEGADDSLFKALQQARAGENEIRTIAGSLMGKLTYMYTLMLSPAYSSAINAFARNAAERDSADAAIAAELYRRQHGKWPAKLDELVPEFLPAVPIDPFTNLPLVMKANAESYKVYSVGLDGVDNSGNLASDQKPGTDIGFEMPAAGIQP